MIIETILPIFIIVAIGFIVGRNRKIDTTPFVDLIVYIAGPCLIIFSLAKNKVDLNQIGAISGSVLSITIISLIVSGLILKFAKIKAIQVPMVFGNTGNIGYPVALFAFGALGLSYAIIYDLAQAMLLFSVGVFIYNKENNLKEIFKLPLIYATILGITLSLLEISLPQIIARPLEMVGLITIPTSLLILGYNLNQIRLKSIHIPLLAALYKIGAGFAIALLVTNFFQLTDILRNVIIMQAAMPSAVMSMILAQKYKANPQVVASTVLVSSILSLLTIPLFLAII